jgi:hypothetical protein
VLSHGRANISEIERRLLHCVCLEWAGVAQMSFCYRFNMNE